jgi:hypothetical protein
MALRDVLRDLSAQTQSTVLSLFERFEGGGFTRDEFVAAAAAVIAQADGRAVRAADRSVAIQLSLLSREQIDTEPSGLEDQRPRLREALNTILDERPEIATSAALLAASQRKRLERIARSEPLRRGQEAVQKSLQRNGFGWVRAVGPNACPLCQEWDDGEVRSADVPMPHHTGCSCVQVPVRL